MLLFLGLFQGWRSGQPFECRAVVRCLTGRVQKNLLLARGWEGVKVSQRKYNRICEPILNTCNDEHIENKMIVQIITKSFSKRLFKSLTCFRTGAKHPLLQIDGCKCTRCTRSNDGPASASNSEDSNMYLVSRWRFGDFAYPWALLPLMPAAITINYFNILFSSKMALSKVNC